MHGSWWRARHCLNDHDVKQMVPRRAITITNQTMVEDRSYEVLYFKRVASNKVHRQRGVSTMDGILTVSGDRITLKNAWTTLDGRESDEKNDDESIQNSSWRKKKGNQAIKKSSLYSGTQGEIANRVLNVEDSLIIGGYEVQIVSVLAASTHTQSNHPTGSGISNHTLSKNPCTKKTSSIIKKPATKLLGKRKVAPSSVCTIGSGSSLFVPQNVHPMQSSALNSTNTVPRAMRWEADGSKSQSTSTSAASQQTENRPMRNSQGVMFHGSIKTPLKTVQRKAILSRRIPRPESTVSPKTQDPLILDPQVVLSSQIPLPASVRSIMRPHQVTGIEFLWKTLHEKQGCILGDEMGLGVRKCPKHRLYSSTVLENAHDDCHISCFAPTTKTQGRDILT